MTIVYLEDRTSPATRAKIAELELALAQARHFVRYCELDPQHSEEFKTLAGRTREQADRALDGSIHSFTPNGVRR